MNLWVIACGHPGRPRRLPARPRDHARARPARRGARPAGRADQAGRRGPRRPRADWPGGSAAELPWLAGAVGRPGPARPGPGDLAGQQGGLRPARPRAARGAGRLAALGGVRLPLAVPAIASLACGAALFFAPDLVTRVNAAERRADFRHALTSYLDLVALERGAGAAPTEALEAAAEIGGGWAFERITAALDAGPAGGQRALDRAGRPGRRDRRRRAGRPRRHRRGGRPGRRPDPGDAGGPGGLDARRGARRGPGQGGRAQHHDG